MTVFILLNDNAPTPIILDGNFLMHSSKYELYLIQENSVTFSTLKMSTCNIKLTKPRFVSSSFFLLCHENLLSYPTAQLNLPNNECFTHNIELHALLDMEEKTLISHIMMLK